MEQRPFDDILAGRKTVEGRLNIGKFSNFQVGDTVSIRRDFRDENGILHDGEPDAARVKIIAIREYPNFIDMTRSEDFHKVIPHASSAENAADEYDKYYSAEEQAIHGVLAIEVRKI